MPLSTTLRLMAAASGLVLLGGCGGDPSPTYQQAFGFQCSQHDSQAARLMCRTSNVRAAEVSRYCYRTLGDTNCFDRPDPDSKNQAVGSSGF